jgi:geranylgeranylglycerol-phosphate geranylgeranyltransferase
VTRRGNGLGVSVRAHVQTWRPYTVWYVGLVGLAGAALVDGPHHPWRLAAAWAAPTAGWIGGHYLGDYFDRDLDAASKPHRPIPSGRLSPATAVVCGTACFTALAVLAVVSGWGTLGAAVLGAFGIVAYSRWFKARGIAGNLVRGALGALAMLYGALAAGTRPPATTAVAVGAFMAGFWLHDTASNLVGTLRDIDGDQAGGYDTLPVRRGTPVAVRTVVALYTVTLVAMLCGGLLAGRGDRTVFLVTLLVAAVLGGVALAPLVAHRADLRPVTALRAHAVLVVERVVLAAGVAGLGLGSGWQLGLGLPMVALTWWTQTMMRTRHEFGARRPAVPTRRVSVEDAS